MFHEAVAAIQRKSVEAPLEAEGAWTDIVLMGTMLRRARLSIGDLEAVSAPIECLGVTLANLEAGMCAGAGNEWN